MSKRGAIRFFKNFSYALTTNVVSLLISTLVVLIVPRMIGVTEYGYWQVYLFYSSYVGFFHFGWNDGIYLRYGGRDYDSLDKTRFYSQFWMLVFLQLFIAIVLLLLIDNYMFVNDKKYTLSMVVVCMVFTCVRAMPLFILQATNRIKDFAQITLIGRLAYFLFVLLILYCGARDYKSMIYADLLGKGLSLSYAMYCCRDFVFKKISTFKLTFKESYENVYVGIKLMFSNIASMLIIGVVRFGIERSWDVETFGKVSLVLSISNLMMLFINAVGIILFPVLRRTDEDKLPGIYLTIWDVLMIVLFGSLLFYYPLKSVLTLWLPKYVESLMYMALLFPIFVYEGKMALLINTYLKTMRKENLMLKINIMSLSLSVILTLMTTVIFESVKLSILSILLLLIFRSVTSELILSYVLKVKVYKDICLELLLTIVFVSTGWYLDSVYTVVFYALSFLIYFILKRKDLFLSFVKMHNLVRG